jgi:hypothetical protein
MDGCLNGSVTANGNYWVAMDTPFGFLFDSAAGWGHAIAPFRQGPLISFGPTVLFTLPLLLTDNLLPEG